MRELFDQPTQVHTIQYFLPAFIQQHPSVQLIVLDSIAANYRAEACLDYTSRSKELYETGRLLKQLAEQVNQHYILHYMSIMWLLW